jgi:tetratricopeptide (TPR) repeat protein
MESRRFLNRWRRGIHLTARGWFYPREAADIGARLAEQFAPPMAAQWHFAVAMHALLQSADRDVRTLRFNLYQKAKFANSFKSVLLKNGVDPAIASAVTRRLGRHLSLKPGMTTPRDAAENSTQDGRDCENDQELLARGDRFLNDGLLAEAAECYQRFVERHPLNAHVLNNLGSVLFALGRYEEAENQFRLAVHIKPDCPEAHNNLGKMLQSTGRIADAQNALERALRLKPNFVDARINLGRMLLQLGRVPAAKAHFQQVLQEAPHDASALFGMGQAAKLEGRFEDAGHMFKRVLEVDSKSPAAWAALVSTRKMTAGDHAWLETAEQMVARSMHPMVEAGLRFAMGKYCDDVGDFERAFASYSRGNELLKSVADGYEREKRQDLVDDLIRVYTPDTLAKVEEGVSASAKPIFVVGMMRSGTSLAEQIIASHPAVHGAGELGFWGEAASRHESNLRQAPLDAAIRQELAEAYLEQLQLIAPHATYVVDKMPANSDRLGLIHSVFPKARFIYMQRDPIDTCLSCYCQQFSPALNFTLDMSDLVHYYREHRRLFEHWREVLPRGVILEVPYAELVSNQEEWTRKMLDFLGLDWDDACLEFHRTPRAVATASFWQVRQKIYRDSVQRWRNYAKFIGPLLTLQE